MLQQTDHERVLPDQHLGRSLPASSLGLVAQGWRVFADARLELQGHFTTQQLDHRLGELFLLRSTAQVLTLHPQAPHRFARAVVYRHALSLQGQLTHQRGHQTTVHELLDHIGPAIAQLGAGHMWHHGGRGRRLDRRGPS